ncbi:MAG TPA: hypothetical protein VGS96_16185 [Thermoanaerobaculia bacterium]|nr:hypothetical protein [Thermoanaerobaculia bacterium]
MKRMIPLIVFATAVYAAEIPVQRVADDAKVVDRVAEAAKRDLPQDLLKRILNEDIEALRGKRADGTYEYATFERLEASRDSKSYSVQPRKNDALDTFDVKGSFVYRLLIEMPSRRMLVTKNRRVFVDHIDLEFVPISSSAAQRQTVKVEAWVEPGEVKPIDFPEVARQGVARVSAKADPGAGYGNFVLTLIHAKVVDNADSPYADAVASAKAIIRAVDNNDTKSIRAMADRMHGDLDKTPRAAAQTVDVVAAKPTPDADIYAELQSIEDLLTGSDAEKRQGLDRLHQLVRRLRPR